MSTSASSDSGVRVILFGAGASAFCGGVTPKNPPLGNALFDQLIAFDPFFSALGSDVVREFRDKGFELGMAKVAVEHSSKIPTFQCLLALYFLQFRVSNQNDNFYGKFCRVLTRLTPPIPIHISTLNYDLLLEESLLMAGARNDWMGTFKLHGSPHYLVAHNMIDRFEGGAMENVGQFVDGDVTVHDHETSRQYCQKALKLRNSFAPALAVYAQGKRVYHARKAIERLQRRFAEICSIAHSILIIGVNLNLADIHLWNPIAASPAQLGVVDPNVESFNAWSEKIGKPISAIAKTANDLVDTPAGLSEISEFWK